MNENGNAEKLEMVKQGNGYIIMGAQGKVGEITYQLVDVDTWVIDHTFVEPEYRGRDLARRLLDAVVGEAREKGRKIVPSCSYALAQFKRSDEYADVWARSGEYSDPYSTDSPLSPER